MKLLKQAIGLGVLALLLNIQAHAIPVALELNLLIDTSGSIDQTEFDLQVDGYEAAFRSASVQDAIVSLSGQGGIAVSVSYFSTLADPVPTDGGVMITNPQIDWFQITNASQANMFADMIGSLGPTDGDGDGGGTGETNIADAINFGASGFSDNGFEGDRLVIDVSTDGVQNTLLDGTEGTDTCLMQPALCTDILEAERDAVEGSITVNGLAIESADFDFALLAAAAGVDPAVLAASLGLPSNPNISDYLELFAITSDGFVVSTQFDDSFEQAITNKLTAEILGVTPVPLPAAFWLLGSAFIGLVTIARRQ